MKKHSSEMWTSKKLKRMWEHLLGTGSYAFPIFFVLQWQVFISIIMWKQSLWMNGQISANEKYLHKKKKKKQQNNLNLTFILGHFAHIDMSTCHFDIYVFYSNWCRQNHSTCCVDHKQFFCMGHKQDFFLHVSMFHYYNKKTPPPPMFSSSIILKMWVWL